jgi:hypothetical protein
MENSITTKTSFAAHLRVYFWISVRSQLTIHIYLSLTPHPEFALPEFVACGSSTKPFLVTNTAVNCYFVLLFPMKTYHITGDGSIVWITASIEYNIGIIFACFHGVKPILALIWPNTFGTTVTTGNKNSGYSGGSGNPRARGGNSTASTSFALRSLESEKNDKTRLTHFDSATDTSLASPSPNEKNFTFTTVGPAERGFSFGNTKPLDGWSPVSDIAGRVDTKITRGKSKSKERPENRIRYQQDITVQSLPSRGRH